MNLKQAVLSLFVFSQASIAGDLKVDITETTDPIAKNLALSLKAMGSHWSSHFQTPDNSVSLSSLQQHVRLSDRSRESRTLNWAEKEQALIQAKGLDGYTHELLEVRLVNPEATSRSKRNASPLVAYVPKGNEDSWDSIKAYDENGQVHYLDPYTLPDRPTLVVDVDAQAEVTASIQLMNDAFAAHGMTPNTKDALRLKREASNKEQQFTKLDRIYINNVKEPWVKGKAEIYSIVSGIDSDKSKALMSVIEMPYLTGKEQEYRPNQILVAWGQYRFHAVNIIMFEHDGNYNYKELVNRLVEAASYVADKTGYKDISTLINLGNAILKAMPSKWYEDSDDFIDAFYTVERDQMYEDYPGAGNNVIATFAPFNAED